MFGAAKQKCLGALFGHSPHLSSSHPVLLAAAVEITWHFGAKSGPKAWKF
jgi:hypothetical protein